MAEDRDFRKADPESPADITQIRAEQSLSGDEARDGGCGCRKALNGILNIQPRPLKKAGKSALNLLPSKRQRPYIKKIIACRKAISVYSKNNQNFYCFLTGFTRIFKISLTAPRGHCCIFQGDARIFKKNLAKEQPAFV